MLSHLPASLWAQRQQQHHLGWCTALVQHTLWQHDAMLSHLPASLWAQRAGTCISFGLSFGLNFAHICCVYSISTFAQLLFCVQHIAMCLFNYLSEGLLCLLCFFLCWAHTHIVSCQHVWPFHICDTCVHRQIEKNMWTCKHVHMQHTHKHACIHAELHDVHMHMHKHTTHAYAYVDTYGCTHANCIIVCCAIHMHIYICVSYCMWSHAA